MTTREHTGVHSSSAIEQVGSHRVRYYSITTCTVHVYTYMYNMYMYCTNRSVQ